MTYLLNFFDPGKNHLWVRHWFNEKRNEKYNDAARRLLTPKVGYGLEAELWRVGVYVKTVEVEIKIHTH
ncbi:predicted protein [Arabidopsis lyrata subsp. lyrata]|uniref:Predicted protein n=1 Tax=Arabidopsis lyrata subsp. lyrata TaxID=81972 RepID=D7MRL6_ARALL|nr:predicted protein [Arabidopsis lyrata subsp. lyrata]